MEQIKQDIFIDGEEGHLKQCHNEQLDGTDFAQNGTEGDTNRTHAEISINQAERRRKR